jgi:hypothetical protein
MKPSKIPTPMRVLATACLAAMGLASAGPSWASSHREAPFITTSPKVDGSDFYMFNSYEAGRGDYVTIVADYQPLQDAYGGPNYFSMDPNALYEINIDNNGDAMEDLTFQFRFSNTLSNGGAGIALPIGDQTVNIPYIQAGAVSQPNDPNVQYTQTYTVTLVKGGARKGTVAGMLTNTADGTTSFAKPLDNIGVKTIADYPTYAAKHIYNVNIPGCSTPGRMFVGQREDPFAVNLGMIFDLVDTTVPIITDPTMINSTPNTLADKNVTALELEVPKACLTQGTDPVIGGWTTASLRQARLLNGYPPSGLQTSEKVGGAWTQVSRLGMPLVNEVVIGLKDKDKFNASKPSGDGQFLTYVTNPTLPALIDVTLGLPGSEPTNLPRNDLVTTFLTGIPGINKPVTVTPSEMLRLNTSIPAVPFAQQNRLGIVGNILAGGSDNAGYPNGRRPKDDVVDISLVVVEGGLCVANGTTDALGFGPECNPSAVPLGATVFNLNDGVDQAVVPLLPGFPYLNTPIGGTH